MKNALLLLFIVTATGFAKAQNRKSYYTLFRIDSSVQRPEFIGGREAFNNYIISNQHYIGTYDYVDRRNPIYSLDISCFIETDSTLSNIKIINNRDCAQCDSEAIRLLKLSPKWKPGIYKGKPKRIKISIYLDLTVHQEIIEHEPRTFTIDELKKN